MAKKMMYESPQAEAKNIATSKSGGEMPNADDIVKSANARGMKRHDVNGEMYADEKVLPSSNQKPVEWTGIKTEGYLVKKNLPYGVNAMYNSLPPGMDIEDQEITDQRVMEMKTITRMGYPGDGWEGS